MNPSFPSESSPVFRECAAAAARPARRRPASWATHHRPLGSSMELFSIVVLPQAPPRSATTTTNPTATRGLLPLYWLAADEMLTKLKNEKSLRCGWVRFPTTVPIIALTTLSNCHLSSPGVAAGLRGIEPQAGLP